MKSMIFDLARIAKASAPLNIAYDRARAAIETLEDFLQRFDLPVSCGVAVKIDDDHDVLEGRCVKCRHWLGWARHESGSGALIINTLSTRGVLVRQQRLRTAPARLAIPALAALPALVKVAAETAERENIRLAAVLKKSEWIHDDVAVSASRPTPDQRAEARRRIDGKARAVKPVKAKRRK